MMLHTEHHDVKPGLMDSERHGSLLPSARRIGGRGSWCFRQRPGCVSGSSTFGLFDFLDQRQDDFERVVGELCGVESHDPMVLGLGACVMAACHLLARFVSARRATKVDPMVALRYE